MPLSPGLFGIRSADVERELATCEREQAAATMRAEARLSSARAYTQSLREYHRLLAAEQHRLEALEQQWCLREGSCLPEVAQRPQQMAESLRREQSAFQLACLRSDLEYARTLHSRIAGTITELLTPFLLPGEPQPDRSGTQGLPHA